MQQLLSTDSFKIASSSVLKELAVNCDLTDLEEVTIFFYLDSNSNRDSRRDFYMYIIYIGYTDVCRSSGYGFLPLTLGTGV